MTVGIPFREGLGTPQECPELDDDGVMWQQATRFQTSPVIPDSGNPEEVARVDLSAVPNNSIIMLMVNRVWAVQEGQLSAGWWTFQLTRNDAGVLQPGLGSAGEIGATTGPVLADPALTFDGDDVLINVQASALSVGQAFLAVSAFFCVLPFPLVTKIFP